MTFMLLYWLPVVGFCAAINVLGRLDAQRTDRKAERMFGPDPTKDRHRAFPDEVRKPKRTPDVISTRA